jgi:ankyrin repeat protein
VASVPSKRLRLRPDDPLACRLVQAIKGGDLPLLRALLAENPVLAKASLEDGKGGARTPLHVVADWPGHYPNGAAVVIELIGYSANPNAIYEGWHAETPLHLAASCDDIEVLDALLDAGADVEARGASIAGGTPLDDAVGYGCWQVARRLVDRGASVRKLWHAAALGMTSRVEEFLTGTPTPTREDVNEAFWHACRGGQRRAAERLLAHGADPGAIPPYHQKNALQIAATLETRRQALVDWLREQTEEPDGT